SQLFSSFLDSLSILSFVPEEHSDLPIKSSGLPNSNIEIYNYHVSQFSTPQQTARIGSTVMETPIPHRDHESEHFTPILEQVAGRAIAGMKDTINEHDRSSSQPEVKTDDENMANSITARPLEQGVVDLEDAEMVVVDLGSEYLEKLEPLSSLKSQEAQIPEESKPLSSPVVQVRPTGESGAARHSPILAKLKALSSSVVPVQPEGGPAISDQWPVSQAGSDSSPELDDDLDDTRVRKKAKVAVVSPTALIEESQNSLQDEVISVKREIPTLTDCPVSADQASSAFPTPLINTEPRSRSANQPKQRSHTLLTGSKHLSSTIDLNSRPHPANQPQSETSFNSTKPNPGIPLFDWNTTSASPSNSVEPNSLMWSTRFAARDEHNSSLPTDTGIRIVFASSSSAGDSKPFLKFLSNKGVKKVRSMHDCTVLCVGKELKKTSKLILAVLLGKDVITDSVKGSDLLSIVHYMARDPKKEADWGISLDGALFRGKQGHRVLQDQTILFTPSAKKELGKNGFDELKEIVKCAGGKSVSSALPKKNSEETSSTVVVATHDNTEMAELRELGWRAYLKDIISLSVLRGKLDLGSDEFPIKNKEQMKESRKRKR
ncbi:MAG: hypothetical protein Q9175_002413, partial [Cornicularia normoerica]